MSFESKTINHIKKAHRVNNLIVRATTGGTRPQRRSFGREIETEGLMGKLFPTNEEDLPAANLSLPSPPRPSGTYYLRFQVTTQTWGK
jgi:hypothetical protein